MHENTMLMVCPICHKRLPVDPAGPSDDVLRITCTHCSRALVLDRYAGELLPDRSGSESDDRPVASHMRRFSPAEQTFYPRLSTGRDTVLAAIVIVIVVAGVTVGMRLALGTPAATVAWPNLSWNQVREHVEAVVTQFSVGRSAQVGGKKDRHLITGKTLVQKGAYAKGLEALDKAIQANPDSYEAHFWRGRALVKTGRVDDAIAAFETAIKLNPRYSYAYDNLGWIHIRRSEYDISLDYLNRSLALRPENGWALYNRGRIHFQLGQREKALQDTDAACRLKFGQACQALKRYHRETQS
jgi:tetratricopeptide (TPR) repeat protein